MSIPKLYHNLKGCDKGSRSRPKGISIYYDTNPSGEEMRAAIQEGNYKLLPEDMQDAAKEAYESLVHTGDGQLCDIVIDRACMEAIYLAGHRSKVDIIKDYTESTSQ